MSATILIEFTNHSVAKEARQPSKLFSRSQAAIEQGGEGMLRHDALARKKPTHRVEHKRINANCVIPSDGHELLQLGSGAEQCLLQCLGARDKTRDKV